MATLSSNSTALEIAYINYHPQMELIGYQVLLTILGRPLLNPETVIWSEGKAEGPWTKMPPGAIYMDADPPCEILAFLSAALEANKGREWWSASDDVELAALPFMAWPYPLDQKRWETFRREEAERLAKLPSPKDPWEIHLTVGGTHFLRHEFAAPVTVRLDVSRANLEKFAADLAAEYEAFRVEQSVPDFGGR